MKTPRYGDSLTLATFKQADLGAPKPTSCRAHGSTWATFTEWHRVRWDGRVNDRADGVGMRRFVLSTRQSMLPG